MRSENKDSGCWNPMGIPLGNIGTKNGRGKCAAKWRNVHILVKPHMYNLRCYSLCMRQLTIASRSVPKAGEHEVLGRHIWAQFAGVAIHTRRVRREVGDAEILQGVRIGGMDQFMRKQAWEYQEQHPSTSVELDMSLHSWIGVVQRLDRRRVLSIKLNPPHTGLEEEQCGAQKQVMQCRQEQWILQDELNGCYSMFI